MVLHQVGHLLIQERLIMASKPANDLIERLESLKAQLLAGDESARKEALMLSRVLTVALNEPANTAVELAFSAST